MGRSRITVGFVAAMVAALVVMASGTTPTAAGGPPAEVAVPACSLRQLTQNDADSAKPAISGDGRFVTFTSDMGASGTPNHEVFLLEVDTGELTQLTFTATSVVNADLDIDVDGSTVAFRSTGDLAGTNADGTGEIFTVETATGTAEQRTSSATGGSFAHRDPVLNDAGGLAWASARNPLGTNGDGNLEAFFAHPTEGTVQVTTTTGSGLELFGLDLDGNVLFETTNDEATVGSADNPDTNNELFVAEPVPATTTYGFRQLTDTTGGHRVQGSFSAGTSGDVGIASNAQIVVPGSAGGNVDRMFFISRLAAGGLQESVTPGITEGSSLDPVVAGEASTRIAFISNADLSDLPGTGAKGGAFNLHLEVPEPVYVEGTDENTVLVGLTHLSKDAADSIDIDRSGRRIVFDSTLDHTGLNPDLSNEVFVAFCGAGTPSFSDVGTGHPFFHQIEWMAAAGVTTGFPEGTFRPSAGVTRQSMSAFMFRLAGFPLFTTQGAPSFSDVGPSHPFFEPITWMAVEGITEGFPDGTFRPAAAVTRQSMSAFMFRLADITDFDPEGQEFGDVSPSHPFFEPISWMAVERITTGFLDGTFRPSAPVSRQAMSAFMHRLISQVGIFGTGGGD